LLFIILLILSLKQLFMVQKGLLKIIMFFLITIMIVNAWPVSAVDSLQPSDFEMQSWSKTIDFFDYVRDHAAQHNKTPPPENAHAYLYLTYINVSGMQMLYAGLSNITMNQTTLTIPIQTFMLHYKSRDGQKDVITASSFIMLLAFSEGEETIFLQSPDRNDTLYASFSLGYDLKGVFGDSRAPSLNTRTEIIPLTSEDNLTWTWGMRYMNLTAIWWRTSIDPHNPIHDPRPIAISRYEELTFTYNLTVNPENGEVTLSTNYVVGRMTDLWVFWWLRMIPFPIHHKETGCYSLRGVKLSDENIYSFLQSQGIKMSIVQFQSTVILNHTAYFNSSGLNVTDKEVFVDNSTISTFTDDGEKIFDADFSVKKTYNLFNYTSDPTETNFTTHNVTTRTCRRGGFARNPIFKVHTLLMRFIPLVVANMSPELYQEARDRLLNMSYADYFYVIAYPTYGGYRIEHDPTYIAYCSLIREEEPSATPETPENPETPETPTNTSLMIVTGAAVIAVIAYLLTRRRP